VQCALGEQTGLATPRDVLACEDTDLPSPPPGFIAIEVAAAGVALPDVLMLQGRYPTVKAPPVSPGMEAAGSIIAVGEGVELAIG
jgi:NADPH2:quinone reductase